MEDPKGIENIADIAVYVYVAVIILGAVAWFGSHGLPWKKKENVIFTEKGIERIQEEGPIELFVNWIGGRSKKVLIAVLVVLLLGILLLRISIS